MTMEIHSTDLFSDTSVRANTLVREPQAFLDANLTRTSNIGVKVFRRYNGTKVSSNGSIRNYEQDFAEIFSKHEWVRNFIQEAQSIETSKALVPYYKKYLELLNEGSFQEIDSILLNLRVSSLSEVLLVGLLRLTSSWKDDLRSWNPFFERSSIELESRGLDPKKHLNGLI